MRIIVLQFYFNGLIKCQLNCQLNCQPSFVQGGLLKQTDHLIKIRLSFAEEIWDSLHAILFFFLNAREAENVCF